MIFSTTQLAQSLADYLAPAFPGVHFYEDPNQQGSKTPCMFLQQRGGDTKFRQTNRWLRIIRLDLVYLEQFNRPDLQRVYTAAAEKLDELLETFPYIYEGQSTLLRTYRRNYEMDETALHYKFDLQVWVKRQLPAAPYMQQLEQNIDYFEIEK